MIEPSGKFVLRIPPLLHARLRDLSQLRDVSLNDLCRAALETCVVDAAASNGEDVHRSEHVDVARKVVGEELLGVVLFGSQARGEALGSSDIDLLIVIPPSVELTRELYRRWDRAEIDRRVNPHFVHPPDDAGSAGSIWYEVSLDGIVLHERDRDVTGILQELRRAVADGAVSRRFSHGHPYWIRREEATHTKDSLATDNLRRAGNRLKAVELLLTLESWADVVRESQEIVEISLKALLRIHRIGVPRIHDVSSLMEEHRDRFPGAVTKRLDELIEISSSLRRNRELAFYGSEDLTPSEFYRKTDAETALAQARLVYETVSGSEAK